MAKPEQYIKSNQIKSFICRYQQSSFSNTNWNFQQQQIPDASYPLAVTLPMVTYTMAEI